MEKPVSVITSSYLMPETLAKKTSRRKPRQKPGLLDRAIEIWQLPPLTPRPLAVKFSTLSERTFMRAEAKGLLHPIKRNSQAVSYDRRELLKFLGLE